jgi:hypothetical protein
MIVKRLVCVALLLAYPGAAAQQQTSASPAKWLSESRFVASSMETGPIGYLEAWGGSEFGYAYSYSISDAPAGVTVDADTGMLSVGTPLTPGTYAFNTSVRNREDTSEIADFPVRLDVVRGVTGQRSGSDILHRDYVVDSGDYGTPVGTDYTGVLMNIRRAIILDQKSAGDSKLRAAIVFHGGRQYDYVNNRWTFGIQYLEMRTDTPGVRAKLRNIAPNSSFDIAAAILQLGRQYFQCVGPTEDWICERPKSVGYRIDTTAVGDDTVTLKNVSDARRLRIGRYVMVGSYNQQTYGFPPNLRYFEYARVASVNGTSVTLDRPLRHKHKDNYWEIPQDPYSLGVARIYAIDRDDQRLTLRARIRDIEFVADPSKELTGNKLYAAALDMDFENCVIPHFIPTQARFARVSGGSVLGGELDKLVSMVVFEGTTVADLHEGTGVDYLLFKNANVTSGYGIAPRQLRAIDSTLRGIEHAPLAFKGSWTTQQVDISGSTFVGTGPAITEWPPETLVVGQDGVSWDGRRLTVGAFSSSSNGQFWSSAAWEGALVYADAVRSPNWGVITDITGEGDSMVFEIDWKAGPGPTAGTQLYMPRLHDVTIRASRNTPELSWNDTDAGRQVTPDGTRPFPEGYPKDVSDF